MPDRLTSDDLDRIEADHRPAVANPAFCRACHQRWRCTYRRLTAEVRAAWDERDAAYEAIRQHDASKPYGGSTYDYRLWDTVPEHREDADA